MKLSQIGEFGLIDRLSKIIGKAKKPVIVGIGDDCAVIEIRNPKSEIRSKSENINSKLKYQLITTDALVENVHFKVGRASRVGRASSAATYFSIGQKAMLANISDISAMGGVSTFAVVTIGASKNTQVKAIEALYKGMMSLAKKHKIQIIGGDTVSSPKEMIISITLLGEVEKNNLVLRSGAKVGDVIMVTGRFGGEAAENYESRKSIVENRTSEARKIATNHLASSMIDSSDGLVRSIKEICRQSKVDARIDFEQIPIANGATLDQALFGGEEYELVFTVAPSKVKKVKALLKNNVTEVGSIVAKGKGDLPKGGYEHFSK